MAFTFRLQPRTVIYLLVSWLLVGFFNIGYYIGDMLDYSTYDENFAMYALWGQHALPGVFLLLALVRGCGEAVIRGKRLFPSVMLSYEKILFVIMVLAAFEFIWGLLHFGNPLVYVFGDTYKLAFVPVLYFAVVGLGGEDNLLSTRIIQISIGAVMIELMVILWIIFSRNTYVLFSSSTFLIPLIYYGLDAKRPRDYFYIVAAVSAGILTYKRGAWAAILISLTAILFLGGVFNRTMSYCRVVLFGFVVFAGIYAGAWGVGLETELAENVQIISTNLISRFEDSYAKGPMGISAGVSASGRLAEAEASFEYWAKEGTLMEYLFGMGSGAQYPGDARIGSTGMTHNIHNTYSTFLFRTGVVGELLFLILVFLFMKEVGWAILRNPNIQAEEYILLKFGFVWFIVMLVMAIKSHHYWADVWMALIMGICGIILRRRGLFLRSPRSS